MADIPELPKGFEFHHVGYATASIQRERTLFESIGYHQEGPAFVDPTQGVAGCFLRGPGPRIELLENLGASDTLTPWIKAGIKMYHFAYWVDDIEMAIDWAKLLRAKVTVSPVPAVAFDGHLISFAMLRNGFMLEFIQK